MPSSVYDLLETRGVVLELPEVLDLASDICGGLVYLHEHRLGAGGAEIRHLSSPVCCSERQTCAPVANVYVDQV